MKITDVKTTVLSLPHVSGFKDATIRHMVKGRTQCFVHILTDEGLEGLGLTGGASCLSINSFTSGMRHTEPEDRRVSGHHRRGR